MSKSPCPECRRFLRGCIDEPCNTCHGWKSGSAAPSYQPRISQDAAYALLEALVRISNACASNDAFADGELTEAYCESITAIADAKGDSDAE